MDSARLGVRWQADACAHLPPPVFFCASARQLERVEELDLVLAHLSRRDERLLVALADVVRNVSLQRVEGDRRRFFLGTLVEFEVLRELVLDEGHLVLHLHALLPLQRGRDQRPAVGH